MLLAHLLRCRDILEKAVNVLRAEDFDRESERGYQLVWAIATMWWPANKKVIPRGILDVELDSRLRLDPMFLSAEELAELRADLDAIYQMAESDLSHDWALEQLQMFVNERRVKPMGQRLLNASPEDVDALALQLAKIHAATRVSSGTSLDHIFQPGNEVIVLEKRDGTGVVYIDELLGGGTRAGEVYGLVGPTGRGKTVAAVQLAVSKAEFKKHVAYFTYEQEFIPEISTRFYGYMGRLPRRKIEGRKLSDLDADDLKVIREWETKFGTYIHPVDMKSGGTLVGSGGPDEVFAVLRDFESRGIHIELAIIDQYMPMIDRYIAARSIPSEQRRVIMQQCVQTFMDAASPTRLNTSFLLIHQSSTAACERPPYAKPDLTDSAECRSFPFWLSTCIMMGSQDEKNVGWWVSTKARGAARDGIIVQLDGENYRFVYDATQWRVSNREFVDRFKEEESHAVPKINDKHDHVQGSATLQV